MTNYRDALIDLRYAEYPDGEEEYQLLKEAANKATAEKPFNLYNKGKYTWHCGTCHEKIRLKDNYCSQCGQKIDKKHMK